MWNAIAIVIMQKKNGKNYDNNVFSFDIQYIYTKMAVSILAHRIVSSSMGA